MTKASSDAARKLAALSNAKGMTKARKIACRRNLAKGRKLRWKKVPKRQKGWLPVE